ncbi:37 kDa cell surface protein [Meyerozyma sp. JA9]|nr:37 kDa cell surface protein [Meyerozyma sp. JA9]
MGNGTKILATGAIAAGGLYYYDKNVQPIFPRKNIPPAPNSTYTSTYGKQADPFEERTNELDQRVSARKTAQQQKISQKTENAYDSIRHSSLVNKLSSKSDELENKLDDHNKNALVRLGDKYIDLVNKVSGEGPISERELRQRASRLQERADREASSWFNWFGAKKDEAGDRLDDARKQAERKKQSWFSWGEKKADEAADKAEAKKNELSKEASSWSAWGSRKKDEAANKLDKEASSWSSWGEKKKDEAADKLDKEASSWSSWGSKKKNEAERELDHAKKDWSDSVEETKRAAEDRYNASKNALSSTYDQEKQRAIDQYNRSKNALEDLTQSFADKTSALFKTPEPEKEEKLRRARADFKSSLQNLKSYGGDVVDDVTSKFK